MTLTRKISLPPHPLCFLFDATFHSELWFSTGGLQTFLTTHFDSKILSKHLNCHILILSTPDIVE